MQAEDGEGKQNKEIGGGEHASPEKWGEMGMRECKSASRVSSPYF